MFEDEDLQMGSRIFVSTHGGSRGVFARHFGGTPGIIMPGTPPSGGLPPGIR